MWMCLSLLFSERGLFDSIYPTNIMYISHLSRIALATAYRVGVLSHVHHRRGGHYL